MLTDGILTAVLGALAAAAKSANLRRPRSHEATKGNRRAVQDLTDREPRFWPSTTNTRRSRAAPERRAAARELRRGSAGGRSPTRSAKLLDEGSRSIGRGQSRAAARKRCSPCSRPRRRRDTPDESEEPRPAAPLRPRAPLRWRSSREEKEDGSGPRGPERGVGPRALEAEWAARRADASRRARTRSPRSARPSPALSDHDGPRSWLTGGGSAVFPSAERRLIVAGQFATERAKQARRSPTVVRLDGFQRGAGLSYVLSSGRGSRRTSRKRRLELGSGRPRRWTPDSKEPVDETCRRCYAFSSTEGRMAESVSGIEDHRIPSEVGEARKSEMGLKARRCAGDLRGVAAEERGRSPADNLQSAREIRAQKYSCGQHGADESEAKNFWPVYAISRSGRDHAASRIARRTRTI